MMSNIIELIKHRITPMDSEHGDININRTFHRDDYKGLDIVIASLKEGEKYRQIVKELDTFIMEANHPYSMANEMKKIKRKYFPKEEKEDE